MSQKIILNADDSITCPHCDKAFPLAEGLSHHLIEQYEDEYEAMLNKERAELEQRVSKEQERKSAKQYQTKLDDLKEQLQESNELQKKAKTQLEMAKKKAAEQAREDADAQLAELKDELSNKDKKLVEFRAAEIQLRKEKKQVEEQKAEMALEVERKLEAERRVIELKINESFSLKEAELKKKITDAQKANEELTRKLEQGSQQLQGEVLELEVESLLQQLHPFDEIEPVKKGARGADVIQTVKLRSGSVCGKIVWETKRAENWSNNWIPKLKEDLQRVNGDIAVLVSTVYPADISEPIVQHEGIWLVRPELVSGLSSALRTVLVESQRQKSVSAGKGEQVEALFDYITSNQFAQRIRAVVETYETMRTDLEKEKAAMQRLWKKRDMQIARISDQMLAVCGELQGISSASLPMLDNVAGLDFALEDE
ncbi:MAG: DUF2130 domain-containing protein [Gammaproteobacteria bacterium]|nr:DUF2130 domain-containing protein [Gammaproteobacteria bacterium]